MRASFAVSLSLHLAVILLAVFGLPYLRREPLEVSSAVPFSVVSADDIPELAEGTPDVDEPRTFARPSERPPRPPAPAAAAPAAPPRPPEPVRRPEPPQVAQAVPPPREPAPTPPAQRAPEPPRPAPPPRPEPVAQPEPPRPDPPTPPRPEPPRPVPPRPAPVVAPQPQPQPEPDEPDEPDAPQQVAAVPQPPNPPRPRPRPTPPQPQRATQPQPERPEQRPQQAERPPQRPAQPQRTAQQPAERDQSVVDRIANQQRPSQQSTPSAEREQSVVDRIAGQQPSPSRNPGRTTQTASLGRPGRLSQGDEAAVRERIRPCWNVDPNVRDPIAVEIRVAMHEDGTVESGQVVDQGRYNADPAFKAAADRALRAVRNPHCQPFPLPANAYQQWRDLLLNFDPRDLR